MRTPRRSRDQWGSRDRAGCAWSHVVTGGSVAVEHTIAEDHLLGANRSRAHRLMEEQSVTHHARLPWDDHD